MRVRDLAAELNVHHREVITFLRSIGEYVPYELSLVEAPVTRTVRDQFLVDPRVTLTPTAAPDAVIVVPVSTTEGLSAPMRRAHRENNPFTGVLSQFSPRREQIDRRVPPNGRYATHTPSNEPGDYSAERPRCRTQLTVENLAASVVARGRSRGRLVILRRATEDVADVVVCAVGRVEQVAVLADCFELGL